MALLYQTHIFLVLGSPDLEAVLPVKSYKGILERDKSLPSTQPMETSLKILMERFSENIAVVGETLPILIQFLLNVT